MEPPTLFDDDDAADERDLESAPSLAALMGLPGIGPARAMRIAQTFGSWQALLDADPDRRRRLAGADIPWNQPPPLLEEDAGPRMLGWFDAAYPTALRDIPNPPAVLWIEGTMREAEPRIAVVGTRAPTRWGRQTAATVATDAARAGITVVSGLALGVDIIAHRAALDAGGRTIAALGGALDRVTPAEHRGDAQRIVATGGALISEQPPGTPPSAHTLVARNRLQTGLSLGTVVVQCGTESGTLETAKFAVRQGRNLAIAIPTDPKEAQAPANQGSIGLAAQPGTLALRDNDDLERLLSQIASEAGRT